MLTLMRPFLRSYMSRASGKLCTGCHSCARTLVSSLLPQEVRQEVEKEGLCAAVRDLPSRGCGMDGGASAPLIGFAKIPLSCAKAAGGNGAWSSRCLRGSAGMRGSCDISVTEFASGKAVIAVITSPPDAGTTTDLTLSATVPARTERSSACECLVRVRNC